MSNTKNPGRLFGTLTILFSAIGWFASFELLTEYIKTIVEPDYLPNCNISVLVSCGPNMGSWQGSVFGFSNTIVGVSAFIAPLIIGVAIIAKVKFPQWFWSMYLLGLTFGYAFIHWLSYQSIFSLHTLCPWCMVVWLIMIPLWWMSLAKLLESGRITKNSGIKNFGNVLSQWAWVIILLNYILIAATAQFKLDWLFTEFGIGSY